ncbi:hypothetical protein [Microbacterium candidum]|uniref:DNA-binding protein n=1 Tax=Microbacterium candidum TaxID=3041922 RepID=A0ABT7N272_9MICO|nr:hypothetical protein [Microbacterium sp. ASV49]MDL9980811.1 hypothetical protein [Microbacterium sp. ASV49]
MAGEKAHDELADALRRRIRESGVIAADLRAAILAGGEDAAEPFRSLARTVEDSSYRVTDAQVVEVRESAGSERAAFEVVMTASAAAGLRRWDAAFRAIAEATDASA